MVWCEASYLHSQCKTAPHCEHSTSQPQKNHKIDQPHIYYKQYWRMRTSQSLTCRILYSQEFNGKGAWICVNCTNSPRGTVSKTEQTRPPEILMQQAYTAIEHNAMLWLQSTGTHILRPFGNWHCSTTRTSKPKPSWMEQTSWTGQQYQKPRTFSFMLCP